MQKRGFSLRMLLCWLIACLCLGSCADDDSATTNGKGQVLVYLSDITESEDSPDTKAPKTTWSEGDAIGVYCVEPGKTLGVTNYASNRKYVYEIGKFKPATTDDNIWISRQGSFQFYAYWPYDAAYSAADVDPNNLTFTVSSDQSVEANRSRSDLIAGQSFSVDNSTGKVTMMFYHMMCDIRFMWTRSGSAAEEYVRTLFGTKAKVSLKDLTSQQVAGESIGDGIRMNVKQAYNSTTGSTEYQAYVPPVTIDDSRDLFIPYDANGGKLSSIKANLGTPGSTKKLERGFTYDLAGNMYTITADVRRNGDLVASGCDTYDGCVLNTTGGGDAGDLQKFVGRYLMGRTCKITSEMGTGLPVGTQFIGWFEYDETTSTWSKIEGATETYEFSVTKNRRLQARYENYVYGPWVISWSHAGVSTDGSGNVKTTIANTGTTGDGLVLQPKATRTVTLDGEPVTDESFTTRTADKIQVKWVSQVPDRDMWNVNPWTYTQDTKTVKVTPNIDFTDNGTSGTPKGREMALALTIINDGVYEQNAELSGPGYDMTVVQNAGVMAYEDWIVDATPTGNTGMAADGSTISTVDVFAHRDWKLSGEVVKTQSTSNYQNLTGAFTTANAAWTLTPGSEALTKPYGNFTLNNGRRFTVTVANNKSESARSNSVKFTGEGKNKTVPFDQLAGVKTNRVYTDWVISISASPTQLNAAASNGTANTSVLTTSATRTMTYDWNNISSDTGSDNQNGSPTLQVVTGNGYGTLSGSTTGSRLSVQKNYDQYNLPSTTPDRDIVIRATLANTENGHSATTKDVTVVQKGGTVNETRDGWTGGSISTASTISVGGGSTTLNSTAPTRKVHVMLNGSTELSNYTETADLDHVDSSNSNFGASTSSAWSNSDNYGSSSTYVTVTGTWSGGSISLTQSSFDRSGGVGYVTADYPTCTSYKRYNTSTRTATLTGYWYFGGSQVKTSTCTVSQSGSTAKVDGSEYTETADGYTATENQSWSSISGGTLTVNSEYSTTRSYSLGSGSISISPSSVGATGGSVSAYPSAPSASWTDYYVSVNRSGTVTATFTFRGSSTGISRSTTYSQYASSSFADSGTETPSQGSVSWPSWAPNGNVSENTSESSRSGTVSVTWSYGGKSTTATASLSQNGATVTYSYEITAASASALSWVYNDTDSKTPTASGTVTIYKSVNGKAKQNAGTLSGCTFSISLSSITGSHFSRSGNYVYPNSENTTSSNFTGTASGTVTATKSGYTITGSKSVTVNLTHTYKLFNVKP